MDLRQLEYFATVASEGTYTAAAERLHVAQPALWKQVQQLERELGVSLFERQGRRVRITTPGSMLLERAQQLLSEATSIRVLADDLRAGHAGRVRVGCFAPHIAAFLAPLLAALRRTQPELGVELHEHGAAGAEDRSTPVESLRAGLVDAITTSAVDEQDVEGVPVYEVRFVAVPPTGRRGGRSRPRKLMTIEALRDQALLVSPPAYLSRRRLEAACRRSGFEPRIEVESSSPAALVALAEHGIGTAILPDDAVPGRADVVALVEGSTPLSDSVWLYRRTSHTNPGVDSLFDAARSLTSSSRR